MPDIVFLQETHLYTPETLKNWERGLPEYKSFFNFGAFSSRGTAILIHRRVPFKNHQVIQDVRGRYTVIKGTIYGELVSLVSVYAPHGDSRIARERGEFFENLIEQNLTGHRFFAGDFNAVYNKDIDRFNSPNADTNQEFIDFIDQNILVDAFRHKYPTEQAWSYENGGHKTRIDTLLVDRIACHKVTEFSYESKYGVSDHYPFLTKIEFGHILIGHDFWKNKPYIYKEQKFEELFLQIWNKHLQKFEQQIRYKINNNTFNGESLEALVLLDENYGFNEDLIISNLDLDCEWWENFKEDIVYIIKKFERVYANKDRKRFDLLRSDYLRTIPGSTRDRLASEMEKQLSKLRKRDNFKFYLDCRIGWEKVHSAFYKEIKQIQENHFVEKYQDSNGDILLGKDDIHDRLNVQYQNLYREHPSDETDLDFFLNQPLPQVQNENTGPFTLEELKKAIFAMADNKCPGLDGIRTEFYKVFFNYIGKYFLRFLNTCVERGEYPPSWKESALQLIPKIKDGIPSFETMRPLTLKNVDYKSLAKMVCNRMAEPAPEIINSNQTGGVPGRQIQNSTLLIHMLLNYYTIGEHGRNGYIGSLENRKVFDMVNRNFLWKVMDAFGYSGFMIDIIKKLYQGTSTRILLNGFLGDTFSVERGVAQGCPMSATLYAIFVEPLARAIMNAQIQDLGFRLPNRNEVRLVQHLDDMTLLLRTRHAIHEAMQLVNRYGSLSGATINYQKSFIIHASRDQTADRRIENIIVLPRNQQRKILGIYFGANVSKYTKRNWDEMYSKIEQSLAKWDATILSLLGRTVVVNTMGFSRLVYLLQTLEYNYIKAGEIYKKLITPFFFKDVVQSKIMYLTWPKGVGGLGVCDLRAKSFSLHMKRFKNFVERPEDTDIIQDPVNSILSFFLDGKINSLDSPTKNLKIMNNTRTTLDFSEIQKYVPFAHFFYNLVKEVNRIEVLQRDCGLKNMGSRAAYTLLNTAFALEIRPFSRKNPYSGYFLGREEEEKLWEKSIFCKYLYPKVQSFNFKLIHRMIPTKLRLYEGEKARGKTHPTVSNSWCCTCYNNNNNFVDESVLHIFSECPVANRIWTEINRALSAARLTEIDINYFFKYCAKRIDIGFSQNIIISEALFLIWKNRNAEYYSRKGMDWREILSKIRAKIVFMSDLDRKIMSAKKYRIVWTKLNRFLNFL